MNRTYSEWRKLLRFTYNEEGICITGCKETDPETIVIPSKIGNRPVIEIQRGALKNNSCTEVIVMEGVKKIGEYAFYKSNLKKVSLPVGIELGVAAFSDCSGLADEEGNIIVNDCYFGNIHYTSCLGRKKILDRALHSSFPVYASLDCLPELTYAGSRPEIPQNKNLRLLKTGETFYFGCYPQTKHAQLLPIEWKVTAKNRFVLQAAPVKYLSDVLWKCNEPRMENKVNRWLNEIVKPVAFTEKEQKQITSLFVNPGQAIDFLGISLNDIYEADHENRDDVTDYAKAQKESQFFRSVHLAKPANIVMELDLINIYE